MSRIWMMVAAVWLWAACEPPLHQDDRGLVASATATVVVELK